MTIVLGESEVTDEAQDAVHDFLAAHVPELLDQLSEWVRIPSVAADPERAIDVIRSANWLADALRSAGLPRVEVLPTGDAAAVYAEWSAAPGAPTVLVYSHHDVRAAKEPEWEQTSPFRPVLRNGRLYGRGSSDAKGQVLAHLWGLRAHLAATGRDAPAVNLKFLVEGEEESASPHLAELLRSDPERFACDVVVFSDTLLWRADQPAVVTSMRGMFSAHLEVLGPFRDVHSGAVSGITPNPLVELGKVLAALHDENGRITLPGFYDAVTEPTESRRTELGAVPFDAAEWIERAQTRSVTGEAGFSPLERLWARPAVEVLSLLGGDPLDISRAVIPSSAAADLSFRTVPHQRCDEVADQLRRWVRETISPACAYELSVSEETAQEAYATPEGPEIEALTSAVRAGWRVDSVVRIGNAGGGPADLLAVILDAPVLFVGTGLAEDHWHDSDESVAVDMLSTGAATLAFLWQNLAAMRSSADADGAAPESEADNDVTQE
jgi:acetylornithine deacetylase/succinyl-diaminopimelate desuccinylase-like protein